MKKLGELLFREEAFSEIVIGNTAIVRAMVESGTRVVTSYPGSPTPEIATAILSGTPEQRPFYFEFSTNEKVATEVAFGASVNGQLSAVFFKSVGLNVAADSFVQLAHMELIGGMVIIIGDDPGANSSQNEQDNRHYARLAYTPMFEPADAQEAYEMYLEAARLSVQRKKPVILRMTTHVCHAKQRVDFGSWSGTPAPWTPSFDPANGPYIPIASLVFPMKERALKALESFREVSETSPFNKGSEAGGRSRGIIVTGLPWLSLLDALEELDQAPDVFRPGMVHPLPREALVAFMERHEEVLILEELDDFIEQQLKALAYDRGLRCKIIGKQGLNDWMGEYTPEKVRGILAKTWPDLALPEAEAAAGSEMSPRPPQLCPGCGHRSAFWAMKQALAEEDITVADIGCHTLGFLPPYEMGQALLSMGHCSGTSAGLALGNHSRRVLTFIGDSTFFHAGLPGIINALYNGHNFTLVVMENGTTAMTGHQDHAGTGRNVAGETPAISIDKVLEALGVQHIRRVSAYAGKKLAALVTEAMALDGLKVIIASHPCMLKKTREDRRSGTARDVMVRIDQETCNQAHTCVADFACPTFQVDGEGKVRTHPDLCIGDASCMQTCEVRAITPPGPRKTEEVSS